MLLWDDATQTKTLLSEHLDLLQSHDSQQKSIPSHTSITSQCSSPPNRNTVLVCLCEEIMVCFLFVNTGFSFTCFNIICRPKNKYCFVNKNLILLSFYFSTVKLQLPGEQFKQRSGQWNCSSTLELNFGFEGSTKGQAHSLEGCDEYYPD